MFSKSKVCELSEAPIKTGIYCVDGKCREMKDR